MTDDKKHDDEDELKKQGVEHPTKPTGPQTFDESGGQPHPPQVPEPPVGP